MAKVQGVDQAVINQVQQITQKPAVQQARETKIDNRSGQQRRERDQGEGKMTLEKALERVNSTIQAFDIQLRFQVDEESGESYVLVIDKGEGRVIRRIPPDNVVNMAAEMRHMIGLMVNELV